MHILHSWVNDTDPEFLNTVMHDKVKKSCKSHIKNLYGAGWKGPGNNDWDTYAPVILESLSVGNSFRSMTSKILGTLTENLYNFNETMPYENLTIPELPQYNKQVVEIRIFHAETSSGTKKNRNFN